MAQAARALLQTDFLDTVEPSIRKKLQLLHPSFDGVTPSCPDNLEGEEISPSRTSSAFLFDQ